MPDGNSYYSDDDASYSFSDLRAMDGTNDLFEADLKLNMTGFNDSIERLWDKNDDGNADVTSTFTIAGADITDVPVVNTTTTNAFITGILWDSGDGGAEFNGNQDIVFVTRLNDSKVGKYGSYDYEVRIPSKLATESGISDLVKRYDELK